MLEIALTIGGFLLAAPTYFAGVRRGKKYRQEDLVAAAAHEADHRIDRVVHGTQTGNDPFRQYSLAGADLKAFVDACVFDNTSVKNDLELLERFGKK
jgi:hypothetical protein